MHQLINITNISKPNFFSIFRPHGMQLGIRFTSHGKSLNLFIPKIDFYAKFRKNEM